MATDPKPAREIAALSTKASRLAHARRILEIWTAARSNAPLSQCAANATVNYVRPLPSTLCSTAVHPTTERPKEPVRQRAVTIRSSKP
jgi:hypothetical protein